MDSGIGNRSRQTALISLPNSGSTWLAEILARHIPQARYAMEYFNPLRNSARFDVLRHGFGCELQSCSRWIVDTPGEAQLDDIYARSWALDGYNFTKEVFSPTKLRWFHRHFRCAVLITRPELAFPPSRLRVYSFYEHAHCAIWPSRPFPSVHAAAVRTMIHLTDRLVEDAHKLSVPVLDYHELLTGDFSFLASFLPHLSFGLDPDDCARDIISTRRHPLRRC